MSDNPETAATSYLPEEVEIRILSLCPVKSLLRFRCVSKRWCSLISDPDIIQLHLSQSNNSPNREQLLIAPFEIIKPSPISNDSVVYFVGTCNGLVCFSLNNEEIIVFNPSTKRYKELPLPPQIHQREHDYYWGFGYDSSIDDYKLVLSLEDPCFSNEFMVLNFKDNLWSSTHKFDDDDMISLSYSRSCAVFLNGSLHWMGLDRNRRIFILSFDLSKEVFKEISRPDEFPDPVGRVSYGPRYLGVIDGCLWMTQVDWNGVGFVMNMWAMKEYNVKSSWVKLFEIPSVSPNERPSPLFFLRNGEILVAWTGLKLVAYCPSEESQLITETFNGTLNDEMLVVSYSENLVSPNCGKDWRGNQQFMNFMEEKVAVLDVGMFLEQGVTLEMLQGK